MLEHGRDRTDEASKVADVVDDVDRQDDPGADVEPRLTDIDPLEADVRRGVSCRRMLDHPRVDVDAEEASLGMGPRDRREQVSRATPDFEDEITGSNPRRNVARDDVDPSPLEMPLTLTLVLGRSELEVGAHRRVRRDRR